MMMAGTRRRKIRGGNGSDYFSSTSTSESWTVTSAAASASVTANTYNAATNVPVLIAGTDEDLAIETSLPCNEESILAISESSHADNETPPRDLLTDWISLTEEDKKLKFLNQLPLVDDATTLSSSTGDKVDCLEAPIYEQDMEHERRESETAMELASSFFGKLTTDVYRYEGTSLPVQPPVSEIQSHSQNRHISSEGTEQTNWSDPLPGHQSTDDPAELYQPESKPPGLPRNYSAGAAADLMGLQNVPETSSPGGSERNLRQDMGRNEFDFVARESLEEKKVEDWSIEMLRSDSCSELTCSPSIYRRTTDAFRQELATGGQPAQGLNEKNHGTNGIPRVPQLVGNNLGGLEVGQTSSRNNPVIPGSIWKQRDWEVELHKQQLTLLANTVTMLEAKLDIFRHELQKRKALSEKMASDHDREMAEVHEQNRRLCQEKDATIERLRRTLDNERMEPKARAMEALGQDMVGLQSEIERVADAYAKVLSKDTQSKQYFSHLQAPKRAGSTFASILFVVGSISALSAFYYLTPRESLGASLDFLCSPAVPGSQLDAKDGIPSSFEAPWWVPNYSSTAKADVFSLLCGERERTKITWKPHPNKGRGVLKLNSMVDTSETGKLETTIWTRHIAVLVELKSGHVNIVHKTGHEERLLIFRA